jgi:hypothetical protein
MYMGLHGNYPLFLSDIDEALILSRDVRKIRKYQISRNPSGGSRVFRCEETDRQTGMTKLRVALVFVILRTRLKMRMLCVCVCGGGDI